MPNRFWLRLALLLVLIAILAFVGARLFDFVLELLESISTGGETTRDPQFRYLEPTQTPRIYTEEEFDASQQTYAYE